MKIFLSKIYVLALFLGISCKGYGQLLTNNEKFSKADTLRGSLTSPLRTCYDINYYHLDVQIDIEKQSISGSNEFQFTATKDFNQLQFDLFENLEIEKIIYKNQELPFKREFAAVFVSFPKMVIKGYKDNFTVYYSGKPTVAKRAPWDGGFVFGRHADNKPWVATACQGLGASVWWPNKDQQADEPDSMLISISVPNGLENISNGRLREKKDLGNGYTRFSWFVANPINNYNVAVNITDYANFKDVYKGKSGDLSLDYYVLPENEEKAKVHFNADVKRMLEAFEHWFGPYPFYKDGFKLIETPHLGMEHQSAVAYGNKYQMGYLGRDLSGTGWGLKWDFIIIHEAGHEWFGNNITSKDIADMWVHEGFTSYSECLFTEYFYGEKAGAEYVKGLRKNIKNDMPVIGTYGVNKEGSGDMYYKGSNFLHTIRTIINDTDKWRAILNGLNTTFGKKTTTSQEVMNYINKQSGKNFTKMFDQYLHYKNIPVLEVKKVNKGYAYKWNCDVKNFDMPIELETTKDKYQKLKPTDKWQTLKSASFKVRDDYYIDVKMN